MTLPHRLQAGPRRGPKEVRYFDEKILLLATGGRLQAALRRRAGWPRPSRRRSCWPACRALADLCEVSAVHVQPGFDPNVGPRSGEHHYALHQNYDAYIGFVIAHSTTRWPTPPRRSSYMVQNSAKPVVLTGSQKVHLQPRYRRAQQPLPRSSTRSATAHGACSWCLTTRSFWAHARARRPVQLQSFSSIDYRDRGVPRYAAGNVSAPPTDQPPVRFYERPSRRLCCGLCRACGRTSSRCWSRTTAHWCWRASASAACRAGSTARCSPPCAAGVGSGRLAVFTA